MGYYACDMRPEWFEPKTTEPPKVTDWYPPEVKPVRVGTYESQIFDGGFIYDWFVHWDGRLWRDKSGCSLFDQNITWRGILEKVE